MRRRPRVVPNIKSLIFPFKLKPKFIKGSYPQTSSRPIKAITHQLNQSIE